MTETLLELVPFTETYEDFTKSYGLTAMFKVDNGYIIFSYPLTGNDVVGKRTRDAFSYLPQTAANLWYEVTGLEAPSMASEIAAYREEA